VIRAKFWVYEHSEPIVLLLVLITGVGLFLMRESTGNLAVTTVGVVLSLAYFCSEAETRRDQAVQGTLCRLQQEVRGFE